MQVTTICLINFFCKSSTNTDPILAEFEIYKWLRISSIAIWRVSDCVPCKVLPSLYSEESKTEQNSKKGRKITPGIGSTKNHNCEVKKIRTWQKFMEKIVKQSFIHLS